MDFASFLAPPPQHPPQQHHASTSSTSSASSRGTARGGRQDAAFSQIPVQQSRPQLQALWGPPVSPPAPSTHQPHLQGMGVMSSSLPQIQVVSSNPNPNPNPMVSQTQVGPNASSTTPSSPPPIPPHPGMSALPSSTSTSDLSGQPPQPFQPPQQPPDFSHLPPPPPTAGSRPPSLMTTQSTPVLPSQATTAKNAKKNSELKKIGWTAARVGTGVAISAIARAAIG